MKNAYPVVLTKGSEYIVVYVPDFNINTQGHDYAEALEMARDAIGIIGIDMEDAKQPLPTPSDITAVQKSYPSDIVSLVDVDFTEYRRKNDMRTVRRNVSLPSWLDTAAKEAGINVSALLTNALKKELRLSSGR